MRNLVLTTIGLSALSALHAQTTLRCHLPNRCDVDVTQCVPAPLTLVVTLDTARGTVTVNNRLLEANFSNPAKVSFTHLGQTVDINRYDSNILMYGPTAVRMGECSKSDVPW